MKVVKQIDINLTLKAVYNGDEKELQLGLSASAPYGKRTATITWTDFPDDVRERVRGVLADILEAYSEPAAEMAEHAAAEARMAAYNLGEAV